MVVHNPGIRSENGRKLGQLLGWNDPDELVRRFVEDVAYASYGLAQFDVVDRIEVDGFPAKADGFIYDAESYLFRWRSRTGFHQPDLADYYQLLDELDVVPRINLGQIDEVWLFGFSHTGYHGSVMAGPAAFWCSAPPLDGRIGRSSRRFVIMGFRYDQGVDQMLESMGHRVESIMTRVYRRKRGSANLWQRFTRYDKSSPGQAGCGNVRFAPNSQHAGDWVNPNWVVSSCDDWYNFPRFGGLTRQVNRLEWGNGDIRQHHLWWLRHIPHVAGRTDGVNNNWWHYILDPNQVR